MRNNVEKKRVVVAGGGYGGLRAVETLLSAELDNIEVILIDQHPYHYLQADVYDYIANKSTITDVTISLVTFTASYSGKLEFMHAEIGSFDFANNKVATNKGEISYDYLILALGSRTFFPPQIEGLFEHSHGVKSVQWAFLFKQRFEQMIHRKVEDEGVCALHPDFNIVIGGGGLSGVEIAAAMAEYASRFFQSSGYSCGGVNIYLIEGAKTILFGLDEYLIKASQERLESLGIKIITGVFVSKVEEHAVYLSDGRKVDMSFMIWTGGIMAAPILQHVEQEKNRRNQLIVDEHLLVKGLNNVFAIGDCAEIKDSDGKLIPPTSQAAEISAKACAENIIALLENRPLKEVKLNFQGVLVALGGKTGAAFLMGKIRFKGYFAYLLKHFVATFYKNPLLHKCKQGMQKINKKA